MDTDSASNILTNFLRYFFQLGYSVEVLYFLISVLVLSFYYRRFIETRFYLALFFAAPLIIIPAKLAHFNEGTLISVLANCIFFAICLGLRFLAKGILSLVIWIFPAKKCSKKSIRRKPAAKNNYPKRKIRVHVRHR